MDQPTPPPLRILIVHNSYQQRGGEDAVAEAEASLLRAAGHQVQLYLRHNDELRAMSALAAGATALWSRRTARELEQLCAGRHPDVIHLHNTFPLVSPAPYWVAARLGIPVVQTLHNFRLLCPQATFLRDGRICQDCAGRLPWRAVTHGCYRDSRLQSAVAAGALAAHRLAGTYRLPLAHYIALSHFCRDQFIAAGWPAARVHLKPNFVAPSGTPAWDGRAGALYVGRLSPEKGIPQLLAALPLLRQRSAQSGRPLQLRAVGDGPLGDSVAQALRHDYLGRRTPDEIRALLHRSQFLVAPSTCLETFGLAAVEAYSCGVPVIAFAHGGLGELVVDGVTGLLAAPGDVADLTAKILWAHAHPEQMLRMGRAAYQRYLERYTPQHNLLRLEQIYHTAMQSRGGQPSGGQDETDFA